MKVGFDARWYNDSGVGTYVAELLKALLALKSQAAQGEPELELVIYEDPGNPVPGLPQHALDRIPLSAGKYSPTSQFALSRQCARDRIDVFHSPFYPIPLGLKCPVVVTLHDLIPFLFPTDRWLKRAMVKLGYRAAAARSRRIIAVSQHTAQDIRKILWASPQKITTIHNGVCHSVFHGNAAPSETDDLGEKHGIHPPYVVVGSARNWQTKNLAAALRALLLARNLSGVDFQTVVYGPPEGLQATGGADAWKQLCLAPTGLLSGAELARLFRHAELFIMPSLYEGFGLPVVEAMACGCAVITSNAGSLAEIGGDGAQAFDPFNVSGMAHAAARLLSDADDLSLWKERALTRAAAFSWANTAKQTAKVYHQAIGNLQAIKCEH